MAASGVVAAVMLVVFAAALAGTALAASPIVEGESVSGVTPFGATAEALIEPGNETTSCMVEYGETTSYGSSIECSPASLEGSGTQFVSAQITGLELASTYHFRVVAANGSGETKGADVEFTTLALESPLINGEVASGLTSTHATLNAQINPNYQETTYSFEYALTESLTGATTIEGEGPLPAEFAELPVHTTIGSLQPGTTYYYRVLAKNASGTTEGPIEHFTTTTIPAVGGGEAQDIMQTTVTLAGTINPAGAPTTYRYLFVNQAGYEAAVAAATDPYTRSTPAENLPGSYETQAIGPTLLSELKPGTTYHFVLVATNSVGTVRSSDATFTTAPPTPPTASTGAAEAVTQNGATIRGSVDTRGLPTVVQFEFGPTPYTGSLISASAESAGGSIQDITASFGNLLQPGVTYYYRAVASNRDGTVYGAEMSFTTNPAPSPFTVSAAPPLLPNPDAGALEERPGSRPPSSTLTRQQKLAKALKACARKPKQQQVACRRSARKRFGSVQRKH